MATSTEIDSDGHFFEGTEKLLEVWWESDDTSTDLRDIKRKEWEELLEHVNCQILSTKNNDSMTAYLLSESSMFVSKQRFILKTCGKTTLLCAIKPLLSMVKSIGFNKVVDVFYSRKNYMRPELQSKIHQRFDDEVDHLEELFDNGAAYALGRINHDCWYLYTIDHSSVMQPDQTLELLMQDLDPPRMAVFSQEVSKTGHHATQASGIADLLPNAIIDDWMFEPCGYSMNAILEKEQYFTIHITPEPDFSYVSFETNVPQTSYLTLIGKVLDIFRPGKFSMTLFANKGSVAEFLHKELRDYNAVEGFHRTDHQFCQVKTYNLTYTMFKCQSSNSNPI